MVVATAEFTCDGAGVGADGRSSSNSANVLLVKVIV